MRNESDTVSIYESTREIGHVAGPLKKAWRKAVAAVRAMAHADGVTETPELNAPKGRASYRIGRVRAVTTYRVR